MQIKTLTGHLTSTEKTHIKAIFKANLLEAKVNRKNYFLTLVNPLKKEYKVKIVEVDKNIVIGKKLRTHFANFQVKN